MALILRYRVEPPPQLNQEVYDALAAQIGEVGLNLNIPLGEQASVGLVGQFISVEGEHYSERTGDRAPEEEPKVKWRGEPPEGDGPYVGSVGEGEEFRTGALDDDSDQGYGDPS